jgi:hypothetical protein
MCAALPSPAAVLYKSVSASGTVEFSDLAPEKGRNVERIRIADTGSNTGAPVTISGPSSEEKLRETDAAVARANAQLDMAEHALAEARRSVAKESDPMRMVSTRMSREDHDRLAFYKKDVLLARAQLLEALKDKRKAEVTAGPVYTASNVWVPVTPGSRQ